MTRFAATTGRAKTPRRAPGTARATPPALGCTGARLRRLSRRVTAFYEHHLRVTGLKLSQYSLLAQLSEQAQTLTALAGRMELDRTTLTRNLQPLLDQGLVSEAGSADARQRLFVLSADGARMRTAARKQWRRAQLALEAQLGGDFVARLHDQLEEALSRLKPALPEDN
ncbi:MAG: MarR family winged helix-turn-helix transcriptional regulator [Betaproteobacteria bacterium]